MFFIRHILISLLPINISTIPCLSPLVLTEAGVFFPTAIRRPRYVRFGREYSPFLFFPACEIRNRNCGEICHLVGQSRWRSFENTVGVLFWMAWVIAKQHVIRHGGEGSGYNGIRTSSGVVLYDEYDVRWYEDRSVVYISLWNIHHRNGGVSMNQPGVSWLLLVTKWVLIDW